MRIRRQKQGIYPLMLHAYEGQPYDQLIDLGACIKKSLPDRTDYDVLVITKFKFSIHLYSLDPVQFSPPFGGRQAASNTYR